MSVSTQAQLDALNITVCLLRAELSQMKADRDARDAKAAEDAARLRNEIESACESTTISLNGCLRINTATGELKMSRPQYEEGRDYIVSDGQVFINRGALKGLGWRSAVTERGDRVAVGVGVGVGVEPKLGDQVRQVIRDELKPGGMLYRNICRRS